MGKPIFKLIFTILLLQFLVADPLTASGSATLFYPDSLPKIYRGYRLSLANFRIEKESKKSVTLNCIVANTGRLPVIFSEKSPAPIELVIELDTAELPPKFADRVDEIETAILMQKINLAPGKFRQGVELEISNFEKEKVEKPGKKGPEPVEKRPAPPKTTEKPPARPTEKKVDKPSEPTVLNSKKEPEKKEKSIPRPVEFDPSPVSKKCGDLIFDTIWLIKKSKKMATLGFRIQNIGSGSANIGGDSPKKQTDNLAVNVYFSGSKKMSRGAILADGIFIGTDPKGNSLLLPGEKFEAEIQIPLENQTRFMPNVIFELDPFQTVGECDKTNNTRSMSLPEN